ncbi:MAG: S-layer homology domain-containing protein, partial [Syntrophomonadaceae bacterium]|nr:S-layer homology domain-containing protein [Syntrophomonadaceae bacterium]
AHSYTGGTCVCGATEPNPSHAHSWASDLSKNATHHWYECEEANCDITDNSGKNGYAAHSYTGGTCVCGATEPNPPTPSHTHSWASAWSKNATHHWHECSAAGCNITNITDYSAVSESGYAEHSYANGTCVCGATAPTQPPAPPAPPPPPPPSGGDTTDYYTLTFDTNGGSAISSISRAEYSTISLDRYTPKRAGFAFTGWYSDEGLTNKITSIRLTRNTTVYAGWTDETNPNTGFENPFTDVSENDWFFNDVMFVFANDLMTGVSDTLFDPYGTTTRAMAATTIWRMEGSPAPTGSNPFTDVANGEWYTDAILWAAESNIAGGYGGGLFGTNDPITREQLAAFFYHYAEYKGYDTDITGSLDRFTDKGDISDWAVEAMEWAVGCGLIEGKTGSILDPKGNATRAEFAAMLHRFIEKNKLEEGIAATGLTGWIDPKRTLNIQTQATVQRRIGLLRFCSPLRLVLR